MGVWKVVGKTCRSLRCPFEKRKGLRAKDLITLRYGWMQYAQCLGANHTEKPYLLVDPNIFVEHFCQQGGALLGTIG